MTTLTLTLSHRERVRQVRQSVLLAAALCLCHSGCASAALGQLVDQGPFNPRLKGIHALSGIKVEVLAEDESPGAIVAIGFDQAGSLYLLKDSLLVLRTTTDGALARPTVVMDDLVQPTGLLIWDEWVYWTSQGQVLRRRAMDQVLFKRLQAEAEARKGPPTVATADGKWIEQRLVEGLNAVAPFQASSMARGPDGWLYVASGSGDQRAVSWDGSKAVVLRSGVVFRLRPDGSELEEFACGIARPEGGLVFDDLGNLFCVGDDVPGVNPLSSRLIHVLTLGDYGWRHAAPGKNGAVDGGLLATPDRFRVSVRGERAGTFPPVSNDCRGSGAVIYGGSAFPESFQGLLITADPGERWVLGTGLERSGFAFESVKPTVLMRSEDLRFRPAHVAVGPDGAIYVAEGASANSSAAVREVAASSRVFRLSWSGNEQVASWPRSPQDSWKQVANAASEELLTLLESRDQVLRGRAAEQLVSKDRAALLTFLGDPSRGVVGRAAALFALTRHSDNAARELFLKLLDHEHVDLACLAAEAVAGSLPKAEEELEAARERVKQVLSMTRVPRIERAMRLLLGRLAKTVEDAEWGFESMSVTHRLSTSRYLFDAHVRALEMVPGAARELMIGNLDVAINMPEVELEERVRLKEFVTLTAEAMRSRELADFLDALMSGEEDMFAKMEAPLQTRLLACYRNALSEEPVTGDAIIRWLERHPGGPAEVEIAALETIVLVGTTKSEAITQLADRLLTRLDNAIAIGKRLLSGHLDHALLRRVKEALTRHAETDNTGRAASMLIELEKLGR